MPNLFRHPTGHSDMHDGYLACEVLKQVQHDDLFRFFLNQKSRRIFPGFPQKTQSIVSLPLIFMLFSQQVS